MENSYAQALWRMLEGGTPPLKAVSALREALVRCGREALLPRIARAFERIQEREARANDVILSVASEKDERKARASVKDVLKQLRIESRITKTRVDETMIGGWRLEGQGLLVDNSYKKHLLHLYSSITK